jgi:hypothetical protein
MGKFGNIRSIPNFAHHMFVFLKKGTNGRKKNQNYHKEFKVLSSRNVFIPLTLIFMTPHPCNLTFVKMDEKLGACSMIM